MPKASEVLRKKASKYRQVREHLFLERESFLDDYEYGYDSEERKDELSRLGLDRKPRKVGPPLVCALGLLCLENNVQPKHEQATLENDEIAELVSFYEGLTEALIDQIPGLNDGRGFSFTDIADWLEKRGA